MTEYQRELQARIRAIHAAANPPSEPTPTAHPDPTALIRSLIPAARRVA